MLNYFMKKFLLLFIFLIFTGIFQSISAQAQSPVWMPPGAQTKPKSDAFSYDIGINNYNKDTYLYVNPALNMNFDGLWGFALQMPLNLLLYDREPKMEGSKVGMLRPGDYNNKQDYQRMINFFWVGTFGEYKPKEVTYSLYFGRMFDGYIGHGTIINRYVNNQRVDIYKLGVQADINTDYGGAQIFTNSVYDRQVNAGRAYVRPYGIGRAIFNIFRGGSVAMFPGNVIDEAGRKTVKEEVDNDKKQKRYIEVETDPVTGEQKEVEKTADEKPADSKSNNPAARNNPGSDSSDSIFYRLAFGYTNALDGRAPNQLDFDSTGNVKLDKYNDIQVKNTKPVSIEGYDAEWKVISSKYFELTPYADYNRFRHIEGANGRHYGAIARIGGKEINLTIRPESRRMTSNYIPMYFDSFYEIERFQSSIESGISTTKYESLMSKPTDGKTVSGYYHTIILNIYNIGFEANYEDYQGKNNSRVFIGAYVPIMSIIRFSAFYTKKGFDRSAQAFKIDDKAQGAVELAISLGPVAVKIQDRRRWMLDPDTNSFKAKDEQMLLFSGGLSF